MLWICQQLQALCLTSSIPFDALMHASQGMFQFYKRKLDEEKKVALKSGVSTVILLFLLDRLRPCFYGETLDRGPETPSPRANFTACLHRKNVIRVMISCLSQGTEISACACSVWRDLAQLGELTHLKPFTWEKVGSPPKVTLSCQPSDPTPRVTSPPSRPIDECEFPYSLKIFARHKTCFTYRDYQLRWYICMKYTLGACMTTIKCSCEYRISWIV